MGKVRCGKCEACKTIESTKRIMLSGPSDTGMVEMWNNVLYDNPCQEWGFPPVLSKPYPGLTMEESIVVAGRLSKVACGKCEACKKVKEAGAGVAEDPYEIENIERFNKALYENPCQEWK